MITFKDDSVPTALVFPGQGVQQKGMLSSFSSNPKFPDLYEKVCTLIGRDLMKSEDLYPKHLELNLSSSLFTVLASIIGMDEFKAHNPNVNVLGVAGYSAGFWASLYSAGMIDEYTLLDIVATRAKIMDACLEGQQSTGMLAVIGVSRSDIVDTLNKLQQRGSVVVLSNDNAPALVTLSGNLSGLSEVELSLRKFKPKKVKRVPVAGAWHSPYMEPAVKPLAEYLDGIVFKQPNAVVINTANGQNLTTPTDPLELSRQLLQPVQWRQSVKHLISTGVMRFVEIGYGDMLTRFGFFIDRTVQHLAIEPLPRQRNIAPMSRAS